MTFPQGKGADHAVMRALRIQVLVLYVASFVLAMTGHCWAMDRPVADTAGMHVHGHAHADAGADTGLAGHCDATVPDGQGTPCALEAAMAVSPGALALMPAPEAAATFWPPPVPFQVLPATRAGHGLRARAPPPRTRPKRRAYAQARARTGRMLT